VGGRTAPLPEADFGEFFRDAYRPLVRDVIFAGGTLDEAEDAVSAAMVEVLRRWDAITNPRAYARRAAINNMIKNRQRGLQRITERLIGPQRTRCLNRLRQSMALSGLRDSGETKPGLPSWPRWTPPPG
jgi:DNA-directed RNA polymerase specialized sigma24 family protein